MDSFFDRALAAARQLGASDIHFKPGLKPILRINGELRTWNDIPAMTRDFLHSLAMSLLNDRRREILERTGDVTVALPSATGMRQRVHISQQRGGIGVVLRLIPPEVPSLDKLGLPPETRELLAPGPGLVLVASGSGGGRTTTLAAMLDDIVRRHPLLVVTIEDPVEILLQDRGAVVIQREVGLDVPSAAAGLRAAARMDADVLMVGDLSDGEAAELALSAAETGRLVLAGMTAESTAAAVSRLVALWEPPSRPSIQSRLATALRGVLHQRLVRAGGKAKGRTAEAQLSMGDRVPREAIAALPAPDPAEGPEVD